MGEYHLKIVVAVRCYNEEKNISGVVNALRQDGFPLVVVDDGKLVGIFSERDYVRKVALDAKDPKHTPIQDVNHEG